MIKLVLKLSPNEREWLQAQHVSIKDIKIDEKLKSLKIEFSSKINLIFFITFQHHGLNFSLMPEYRVQRMQPMLIYLLKIAFKWTCCVN